MQGQRKEPDHKTTLRRELDELLKAESEFAVTEDQYPRPLAPLSKSGLINSGRDFEANAFGACG